VGSNPTSAIFKIERVSMKNGFIYFLAANIIISGTFGWIPYKLISYRRKLFKSIDKAVKIKYCPKLAKSLYKWNHKYDTEDTVTKIIFELLFTPLIGGIVVVFWYIHYLTSKTCKSIYTKIINRLALSKEERIQIALGTIDLTPKNVNVENGTQQNNSSNIKQLSPAAQKFLNKLNKTRNRARKQSSWYQK